MLLEFVSKSPPNCGLVSPTRSDAESETSTVFDDVLKVANVISSEPSKNFNINRFDPELDVSSQKVPVVADDGLDVPELEEFIADNTVLISDLTDGKLALAIVKSVACALFSYTPFKNLLQ